MYEVKSKLNIDEIKNKSISRPYPNLVIKDLNKCLPVIVSSLKEGDLSLLCTFKGVTKEIKKISNSAININYLLSITDLEFHKSPEEKVDITNITEYLEVAYEWIC